MARMNQFRDFEGYMGAKPPRTLYEYIKEGDRVHQIHTVFVHEFRMNDAEDPDLYAAEPMWAWQNSEQGQWVMAHAMESPMWHKMIEPESFGWCYRISAKLKGPDYTFYTLKWGQKT